MIKLPNPAYPAHTYLIDLDGQLTRVSFVYDELLDSWYMSARLASEETDLFTEVRLTSLTPLRPRTFSNAFRGVFFVDAWDYTTGVYEQFTDGSQSIWWASEEGWLEIIQPAIIESVGTWTDTSEPVPDPITPIVITYPPNNAIVQSGVVNFNGTGPLNQDIYCQGQSIHVDGNGFWSWITILTDLTNKLTFTGQDGQTASVTLNVLSDPLKMDPVGELIDGKYYVFTDSITVTGTAQPSIPIVVNGQTVQVDAQGDWSATVSVVHGENVIRAVGDDGQIVQRVVWLFDENDVLAMGPIVFVDTLDESTLWIDEHKTQSASSIGDPVWVVENKGTLGDLADFSSATSADRPVRRVDGITDGRIDCTSLSILPRPYSVFGSAYRYGGSNGGSSILARRYSSGKDGDVGFFTGSGYDISFAWERRYTPPVESKPARSAGAIVTGQEIPGDVYLIRVNADEFSEGNPDPDGQYELPASPTRNYTVPWSIMPNSVMTVAKFILFDRALSKDNAQLICKWMRAMEITP